MARKHKKIGRRGTYTDDSGIVISQSQYAELHGEKARSNRQRLRGVKLHHSKGSNIFAKIGQKGISSYVQCEYCQSVVPLEGIAIHTKDRHFTFDLRFRPVTQPPGSKKLKKGRSSKESRGGKNINKTVIDDKEKSSKMAHYRREWNGQFGSYPLHDDYGDESDSK